MTPTDTIIVRRLQDAAERIPVESKLDAITQTFNIAPSHDPQALPGPAVLVLDPAIQANRPGRSRARLALAAALCAVVVGGLVLSARPNEEPTEIASESTPKAPTGIPEGAPPPGSVAPFVEEPPEWFGRRLEGRRDAAARTGRWVTTAIGLVNDDGMTRSPIIISVTDGTHRGLDGAQTVVVDGDTYQQTQYGQWQTLATTGSPTILASGAVDAALLAEVHRAAQLTISPEGPSVHLIGLPDGYRELIAPQLQAEDVPNRRTLTNAAGDVSINEISDWAQPELAAAATGADYQPVNIGELTGWTGQTDFNPDGPLTFLIWSPSPGLVLEIDTTNSDRTIEELVALAALTHALPITQWDEAVANL